ncbi:MAG: hypothetical protein FWH22_05445 [Fibromonadales bacterium]|nr:hypothetical protein [Fibromonadales bacterium]
MSIGMAINSLKSKLAKSPKSLLFAPLADVLRQAGKVQGYEQQLDEALDAANKGLKANPDFLPGKLARGQILFDKGDFAGAKADLAVVAERDPFCLTAQKLLSEISAKTSESAEPVPEPVAEPAPKPIELKPEPVPEPVAEPVSEPATVFDALDDIVKEEEEREERKTQSMLILAVDNIIESAGASLPLPESAAPVPSLEPQVPCADTIAGEQLTDRAENIPDLTGDMESLLASHATTEEETSTEEKIPDLDAIIGEQLTDRAENLPDLTNDMESLLASNAPTEEETPTEDNILDLDAIIGEQLTDRAENIPDLTGDMESLLASASSANATAKTKLETDADDILAQNPTETLAEIYINQGLPQKAVEVYKILLSRDPDNMELKAKLALAELEII